MEPLEISVVIGFKDWGSERLLVSIRSISEALAGLAGEVIVSDYGSADGGALRPAVEAAGARYVYTHTDGKWSRSRALNAGFAVSRGRILVSTDADMLFSPQTFTRLMAEFADNSRQAFILQCRDLPEGYGSDRFRTGDVDWEELGRVALLRPRWGMGGMMAVSREVYRSVRGFDERMEIYGGEDIDFANRVRRAGVRLRWLDHPAARMYHMWHPASRAEADSTESGRLAVERNRRIVLDDSSVMRNLPRWQFPLNDMEDAPLVSVVICTRNRARLLAESIHSVLGQTVTEIEVVVVDDGSTDDTRETVEGIADERVRYFVNPGSGIPTARNFAATVSRGRYTAIHDDDDIMLPQALEHMLGAIAVCGGSLAVGAYGGWINFSDGDGAMQGEPGADFSLPALVYKGRVLTHGALMLETRVIKEVGYDTSLRTGSDFNLLVRVARSGYGLVHTGQYQMLRRLHPHQVTQTDSAVQKASARSTVSMLESTAGPGAATAMRSAAKAIDYKALSRDAEQLAAWFGHYLPDHLTDRTAVGFRLRVPGEEDHVTHCCDLEFTTARFHGSHYEVAVASAPTWSGIAHLRGHCDRVVVLPGARTRRQLPLLITELLLEFEATQEAAAWTLAELPDAHRRATSGERSVVEWNGVGTTVRVAVDGHATLAEARDHAEVGARAGLAVRIVSKEAGVSDQ